MRKGFLILSLLSMLVFSFNIEKKAEAHTTVNLSFFFDALSPYGDWVYVPSYGDVWFPVGVDPSWMPYKNGRWEWSDYGWLWVSYEPWGWITYHYGRWVFLGPYGWVWVPGTVWAPAWVTWFITPGYIGWTPLPPDEVIHHHHHHYNPSFNHCVFVPSGSFLHHNVSYVSVSPQKNLTIIKNVKSVTNVKVVNNRVINYGPEPRFVEKVTRRRIKKVDRVDTEGSLPLRSNPANYNPLPRKNLLDNEKRRHFSTQDKVKSENLLNRTKGNWVTIKDRQNMHSGVPYRGKGYEENKRKGYRKEVTKDFKVYGRKRDFSLRKDIPSGKRTLDARVYGKHRKRYTLGD